MFLLEIGKKLYSNERTEGKGFPLAKYVNHEYSAYYEVIIVLLTDFHYMDLISLDYTTIYFPRKQKVRQFEFHLIKIKKDKLQMRSC